MDGVTEDTGPAAKKVKLTDDTEEGSTSVPLKSEDDCIKKEKTHESPNHHDRPLCEPDVGISQYISQHEGFSGILKQRYSDFLVNEIDPDGVTVRITSTEVPTEAPVTKSPWPADLMDYTVKEQLTELAESKDKSKTVTIKVADDKAARTKIHKAVKEYFSNLDTFTKVTNEEKFIEVKVKDMSGNHRNNRWTKGRGNYCHLVLFKENKDTMDAVNLLSRFLRIKPGQITYAGTKDKRAKTCQRLCMYRVEAGQLKHLNKKLRGVVLGNFSYKDQPLRLGDLSGNHFTIILRDMTGTDQQINQALSSLKDIGFINYYGMQRFGTTNIPTHHIGRALIQNKWTEAIDLILKPRCGEKEHGMEEVIAARATWWETRDAKKALEKVPHRTCIERHLLVGLTKNHKNDLVNALACIPRNTRLMYVHAYQSFIWNTVVSRRIAEHGLKPMLGDLALTDQGQTDIEEEDSKRKPEVVTDSNIDNFTIQDVVLPLVGYDVLYPQNQVGEWYKSLLQEDSLEFSALKSKHKDYSLPGGYRKIIVKPTDVSWEVMHYSDFTEPLVLSDCEIMNGETLKPAETDGKFKALKMEFSLPPSTYATMAIREVLKVDTSPAKQALLNVT